MTNPRIYTFAGVAAIVLALPFTVQADDKKPATDQKVSYYKDIRPIFQAQCQGCHQPAKARGDYIMTAFDKLLAGGESGNSAIVPKEPAKSYLVEVITPVNGQASMPENRKPLDLSEIDLIKRWITEGAVNDTPANVQERFDPEHPPIYTQQPVIPSLDYSPDGKLLAVAGFHEILLVDADSGKLTGRLIGLSERIQSVRFSPDGKRLAATGGQPGRMGEVQVWDVAKKRLKLSVPVTFDTVYGVSWSPDGSKIAFGCADNSLRAIDASSGEQVLFQGGHSDWVLETSFSADGSHLVSVSRDMTVKLTEVATQRLIDNVTSITPGALKGGVQTVARHPKLDHIIAGGSDGIPRAYRTYRKTARMIGDDANLILDLYPLPGRVFSVRFSADGKRIAAGTSLDGKGAVSVCTYDYAGEVPEPIIQIMGKVPGQRNPQERAALAEHKKKGVKELARINIPQTGIYALAFRPDGQSVAVAGTDGVIRIVSVAAAKVVKEFAPAPVQAAANQSVAKGNTVAYPKDPADPEKLPAGAKVVNLDVQPRDIHLANPFAYAQLLVTARLDNGELFDATRVASYTSSAKVVEVTPRGLIRPQADGASVLQIQLGGQIATVPVKVSGQQAVFTADFYHDVNPVLSRMGCNQGTCHGANKGKAGFKLSLRGVDAVFDVRALLDDHACRRVNFASPDNSLALLKATAGVPHVGGQCTKPGEPYYEIVRNWIANGGNLNLAAPRVAKIEIAPSNPILQREGEKQQFRVLATYTNGEVRDVTREAFIESGGIEVATAGTGGLLTALRRGAAPVLARYEGNYAATTLVVMGDRTGFAWQDPPAYNRIDELAAAKWKTMKIKPSEVCGDLDFLRRVYLDLTGVPPTAEDVRSFLADTRASRIKRAAVVDNLIGSPDYVEFWTNKWADLLQVNRKFLGPEGAAQLRQWIRNEVANNTPYDVFARKILTASGSNRENPAAGYFKVLREPTATMENTTHLFLGVRFNCNKCHDHPFERWTQDQYFHLAAFFAQVGLQTDPASGNRMVGGTAVEGGKPLFEIVADRNSGEVTHDRTGQVTPPQFPYPATTPPKQKPSRREQIADWITAQDNQYFAKSFVNRMWGYLFGVGIIEPIDDIRAGNPPSNAELLDFLTQEFIKSGFNVRHVQRLIVTSRTYQLAVETNKWNGDDKQNYSHAAARRLPAEVLFDALHRVTGAKSKIPGVSQGIRAVALPDAGIDLPNGFLATFGRPPRESACECERSAGMQLGPVMALVNGQTIADAIADPSNDISQLVAREKDDGKLINELFVRILNRPATPKEVQAGLDAMKTIAQDHGKLILIMQQRDKEVAAQRPRLEKERELALNRAKAELAAYEKGLAPKIAQAEKAKAERTAQLEAALKKYEASLPTRIADWEKKQQTKVDWTALKPEQVKGPKDVKLTVEADHSVTVAGKVNRDTYTVVAKTPLRGITAVRLEMLTDPRSPRGGPGRANDGNFVLTEFEMFAVAQGSKDLPRKLELINPQADFSQENYDIKFAVDGDSGSRDRGWAVSPAFGVTHWATFQLKTPLAPTGRGQGEGAETVLTFKLISQFNSPGFVPGRFRISLATAKEPVGLSLPEEFRVILTTPADKRDQAHQAALVKYFQAVDAELRRRQKEVADSRQPLAIDPGLQELRGQVGQLGKPLPEDALLVQLRQDVEISNRQLANPRLTFAQDLAWALINSPAFLFNR